MNPYENRIKGLPKNIFYEAHCNLNNYFNSSALIGNESNNNNIRIVFTFVILSFFFNHYNLVAQNKKSVFVKQPIIIDGIEYNYSINTITQDLNGFIWMASAHGLIKYDGYEFKIHKNISGDSTSIRENGITSLYADDTGDLWVGTRNGLSRYDPECDCFYNYSENKVINSPTGRITAIAEDSKKNIWIGTWKGGLYRYNRGSDRFVQFLNDPKGINYLGEQYIRVIIADRKDNIWIGTRTLKLSPSGIIRLNPSNGTSKLYAHNPDNENSLISNGIRAILEDRDGRILVGTLENGLHYFDKDKDEFIRIMNKPKEKGDLYAPLVNNKAWEANPFVIILHQDQYSGYWVGICGGGIYHFDVNSNKLNQYFHNPTNPNGITNDKFWSFHEDRSGQLWLGNLSQGGIHKLNPYKTNINKYSEANNRTFTRFLESPSEPGKIYLGTGFKGLQRLDTKTGKIEPVLDSLIIEGPFKNHNVQDVYEDSEGILWLGFGSYNSNENPTLGQFNPRTKKLKRHIIPKNKSFELFYPAVFRIYEDRIGDIWLGTGKNGLYRFDKINETLERIELPNKDHINNDCEIYVIEDDSNGSFWIGDVVGTGSLYNYNIKKQVFELVLEGFKPICFYQDSSGYYWLGTENSGLLKLNKDKTIDKHYTVKDGLPSNQISNILEGSDGIFWISTPSRVIKFDSHTGTFSYKGLPQQRFVDQASLKSSKGQLFFGGNGLVSFDPNEIEGNQIAPELNITSIRISGKPFPLLGDSINKSDKIILTHEQNDLSFDYLAFHYSNPSKNQYKYKLEPLDKEWIDAGTQRTARYTNLDPGKYHFKVIGSNDNNIWNETGTSVSLIIKSAWWSRWWAYTIYIAIIGSITYSFYRFQLSKKLAIQESEKLHEMDQLKNNLYTSITHEFRTPLTIILGMVETLKSEIKQQNMNIAEKPLSLIRYNGKKLLQLVNEMLDLSKLEAGKMKLQLVQSDIITFIKYLTESFHSVAAEKSIDLSIHSKVDHLEMDFDSKKVATIITNLIFNALKFSSAHDKINVRLNKTRVKGKEYLTIKIKDNGVGIPKKEIPYIFNKFYQVDRTTSTLNEGTGIGLALVKELVEFMNGSIKVKSRINKGSSFSLRFPITNNATRSEISRDDWAIDFKQYAKYKTENDESEASGKNEQPCVLIIEDNDDVAYYIKKCLKNQYETLRAMNGIQGFDMALKNIPDIVISDVMMPKMDGYEVCAKLKEDEKTNHIPIILLTAKASTENKITGLAMGADAYLIKPFERKELMIRLNKLLEVRKTLQKKYGNSLISSQFNQNDKNNKSICFLRKVENIILQNLDKEEFNSNELADSLFLSRSQAHRKLKALTGMSSSIYIRFIRLQKAKELLALGTLRVSEIAYQVGFKSPVYFSQSFKETFGKSPSSIRK